MKENFKKALDIILKHEGGFVNHPKDPGGATMLGITKKTYENFLGRGCTVEDLKNIPEEDVEKIYKEGYWDKIKGDDLPDGLDLAVFDWAVNSGPSRAAKGLQQCVGAITDGAIGPKTLEQVKSLVPKNMVNHLADERERFYKSLNTFSTFGKGWLRRNDETREKATEMTLKQGE